MPFPRIAAFIGFVALSCAALSGCGGKVAPLDDAGVDAGADADDAGPDVVVVAPDGGVLVTRVVPSSGPNSGGTRLTISGAGFATDGGTSFTLAGFPTTGVQCSSDTECVAVTPYPGYSVKAQTFDVVATIHGVLGSVGVASSPPVPLDRFTYRAGPSCTGTLTCEGPYFPRMVVQCQASVSFYLYPLTPDQQLVATGTSYTGQTDNVTGLVAACDGSPQLGSCASFSLYEGDWTFCGAPDFCEICARRGGHCSGGPNPTCTF